MSKLSHINNEGKAKMVDVGSKPDQQRMATATGFIRLSQETVTLVRDNQVKKGDVLTVAEIAGIQGAKETSRLIPLCHPLPLTKIEVKTTLTGEGVKIDSEASCTGKTGVEMEALTAVSVALLTVYDMCKAADKNMTIEYVKLTGKTKTGL